MPNTTHLALPYPLGSDIPQGNAQIQALAEALDALIGGPWQSFTPSYTGLYGNGTLDARYKKIGRTVHMFVHLTFGSTTTTGNFGFPTGVVGSRNVGTAVCRDVSAAATSTLLAMQSSNIIQIRGSAGAISSTSPFTWATGDEIAFQMTYESS